MSKRNATIFVVFFQVGDRVSCFRVVIKEMLFQKSQEIETATAQNGHVLGNLGGLGKKVAGFDHPAASPPACCSGAACFDDDGAASAVAGMMAVARALADNGFSAP